MERQKVLFCDILSFGNIFYTYLGGYFEGFNVSSLGNLRFPSEKPMFFDGKLYVSWAGDIESFLGYEKYFNRGVRNLSDCITFALRMVSEACSDFRIKRESGANPEQSRCCKLHSTCWKRLMPLMTEHYREGSSWGVSQKTCHHTCKPCSWD